MSKTETEYLESARDRLRRGEALIALALGDIGEIVKLNKDNPRRMNAAFIARGRIRAKLGELETAHGEATDLLFEHWPEQAGGIVALGGTR